MATNPSIPDNGIRTRRRLSAVFGSVVAALTLAFGLLGLAQAQQVHRNGFETRTPAWLRGPADMAFKEIIHDVTDQTAHSGQLCEHIQINAEQGSYIHYFYPTAHAPLGEELAVRVWIKANRPGAQLSGRLVLPKERNPNNLSEPVTTLLRGDQYQLAGRWQALELRRPVKLAREQQQLMRAELKRDVDFSDAYIDRLVLNVYGGLGVSEVWIDDLEIGPVVESDTATQPGHEPDAREPISIRDPSAENPLPRHAMVEVSQDHLLINGKRFFFRGIRHTDTPLKTLRDAGFNTAWLDDEATSERIEEAAQLGFWLVPSVVGSNNDPQALSIDSLNKTMSRFKTGDAVLWWDLGGGRTNEEAPLVARTVQAVHGIDAQRPIGGDVWDGFGPYSRSLQLMGAHRWPLFTGMELPQYRDWLTQRRLLARPGTFMWTWVQTHLPDWYSALAYAGSRGPFADPVGPQPEQICLLTYIALSAGCQGVGYWSDRYLADSHQGRDRLLMLALLNQEMQMLEPLLLTVVDPPTWIGTSNPEVKAAVLRTERGLLVLPMWLGKGSQYVPGQSATAQLSLVVPQVPNGTQAWEISPGDVRSLQAERVPGGTKITVPDFGLKTAIVFTSDNSPTGLVVHFQEHARRTRKQAALWAHDLAEAELDKIFRVEEELERGGHTLPDSQALQNDAKTRLVSAKDLLDRGDYRQAYLEAQRALRPVRILMRAQWESAVRLLETPEASVYALSFYTLPKHWEFMRQVLLAKPGNNVLPGGDFEATAEQTPVAWLPQEITLDHVELAAWRVAEEPREGQRCLKLEIKAKDPQTPPGALERTFLAINSPAVKLQPDTLVRISGWMRVPKQITASADGALMYDSAGGEPMAVRVVGAMPWRKFTFFRKVPESGSINVTLALTGIGVAYFDDIRIEPLLPDPALERTAAARP